MMHSNWWLNILSGLEVATLASAVILIWKKGLVAKWPLLFLNLVAELATDVVLLSLIGRPGTYRLYFFIYWGSVAVRSLLRVGIIADIMRSFRGIDFLPWQLYMVVGAGAVTMAAASGVFCWNHSHKQAAWTIAMAFLLNRCASIAWGGFAVAILLSIKSLNLGWERGAARVANGIFFRVSVSLLTSWMYVSNMAPVRFEHNMRLFANGIESLSAAVVFGLWTYMLVVYVPAEKPEIPEVKPFVSERNTMKIMGLCSNAEF
jgi:hypothetical protein